MTQKLGVFGGWEENLRETIRK